MFSQLAIVFSVLVLTADKGRIEVATWAKEAVRVEVEKWAEVFTEEEARRVFADFEVRITQEDWQVRVPIRGKFAIKATLEFGALLGKCLLVSLELLMPLIFQLEAALEGFTEVRQDIIRQVKFRLDRPA